MSRLDDFAFVKAEQFDNLYDRIEDALLLYEKELYAIFCENCRLPLERALNDFYYIASIEKKKIPNTAADKIAFLSIYLPEELFPSLFHDHFTDLNQISCKYNHDESYPSSKKQQRDDSEKCFRLLIECCRDLENFKDTFPIYVNENGPIDYKQRLVDKLAAKSFLPQFNSVQYTQQVNYAAICLATMDKQKRYRESLELDLPAIYNDIYNEAEESYHFLVEALDSTMAINGVDQSLEYLKSVEQIVPRLVATRHVYTYYSLIHSMLFRESWNPKEIANAEYAGTSPSIDEIYWGLTHINLFASKIVFDKLHGHELTRKAFKGFLDDPKNGLDSFRKNIFQLQEDDIVVLDNIGNFRRFYILRDCGFLQIIKEQVVQCITNNTVSTEDIAIRIRTLVFEILSELYDANKKEDWQQYFQFEQKYVSDILDEPEFQSLLAEVEEKNRIVKKQANGIDVLTGKGYLSQKEEFEVKRKQYKIDLEKFILEKKREYEAFVPEIKRMEEEEPISIPQDSVLRELDMSEILTGMTKVLLVCSTSLYMLQQRAAIFIFDVAIDNMPFDRVLSSAEIYEVLMKHGSLGAINLLGKLKCDSEDIHRLQELFMKNDKKGFVAMLDSVSCDKSFLYYVCAHLSESVPSLHDLINDDDDVIEIIDKNYDYYLMQHYDPDSADEDEKKFIEFVENCHKLGLFIEEVKALAQDNPNAPNSSELEKELKDLFTTVISSLIDVYDVILKFGQLDALSFENRFLDEFVRWLNIRPFIEKYGRKTISVTPDVPGESVVSLSKDYHFVLPEDLFTGKVDTIHVFIPGLKNALKDNEVFEPLFNYILRIGGICSDEEAGALLRVFTGYPVENASDKAKWETDYHILYYLVKHMFAAKGAYAKMMECIDISYPSEAERKKAEKAPSSYADRISGADASSILETLSRLSKVF